MRSRGSRRIQWEVSNTCDCIFALLPEARVRARALGLDWARSGVWVVVAHRPTVQGNRRPAPSRGNLWVFPFELHGHPRWIRLAMSRFFPPIVRLRSRARSHRFPLGDFRLRLLWGARLRAPAPVRSPSEVLRLVVCRGLCLLGQQKLSKPKSAVRFRLPEGCLRGLQTAAQRPKA